MREVFLFLIATILYNVIVPVSFSLTILFNLITLNFKAIRKYLYDCAITKDQSGNVFAQLFLNLAIIKDNSIYFGNPDETISSVIGKNKLINNLTIAGVILDKILNLFDKNHSIKSIENND